MRNRKLIQYIIVVFILFSVTSRASSAATALPFTLASKQPKNATIPFIDELQSRTKPKPFIINDELNPKGIALVHAAQGVPLDGYLRPNYHFGNGEILKRMPRFIIEFSWNGVIDFFDKSDVVVIIPLIFIDTKNLINFYHDGTAYWGSCEIPKGATVLIREGVAVPEETTALFKNRGISVIRFSKEKTASKAAADVLPKIGYRAMGLEHDDWTGNTDLKDSKTLENFSPAYHGPMEKRLNTLAKKMGIPFSNQMSEYPLGAVQSALETLYKNFNRRKMLPVMRNAEFLQAADKAYAALSDEQKASFEGRLLRAATELYTVFNEVERYYYLETKLIDLYSNLKYPTAHKEYIQDLDEVMRRYIEERKRFAAHINQTYGLRLHPGNVYVDPSTYYQQVLQRVMDKMRHDLADKYSLHKRPESTGQSIPLIISA